MVHKVFACQNFLKQSCIKFYKEQLCSKSAYKEDLGAVLALSKILLSWRHQFASSVLETSYLFIYASLVFALVDKLVELD